MIGRIVLFTLVLVAIAQTLPSAKEATKQGRNATIVWIDENGQQHEERCGEIRYGYYTRALLTVPKDGVNFRDDEHQDKGLSFVNSYHKFTKIARIDFQYEKTDASPATRLVITITPLRGKPIVETGNTLTGSSHPKSPFIAFQIDGAEKRLDLMPLGSDEARRGKSRIVSADFKLQG